MPECPACGASVSATHKDCPECGVRLSEPTASFDPVEIEEPGTVSGATDSEGPVLVVRKGPQPGERFFVDREKLVVGRDPASDIFLNDMTVSRGHAIIERMGDVITVRDSGSLNGTYVNGEVVDEATLANGDVLQIGTFQMLFLSGAGGER
jgi:pSer/pThr/pTyr-binding forkhead associated (FHA) protein